MIISSVNKKQLQFESKLFKGFADQSRLLILEILLDEPKTVSNIVKATKLSQPNVSAHLACLLECGLVRREKKGREVLYRISMDEIGDIIHIARKILRGHSKEIHNCTRY